ncbi:MAG: virulence RhuM family protein [Acidobacteriota bacterium]|nr:virulence RhuM family protein [Acidobacteriota bacterium]
MKNVPDGPNEQRSEIIIYQTDDGKTQLQVRLENETVWLTQNMMAALFQTTKQNIGQHLKNIFAEGELHHDSVVKKSFTTAADGKQYETLFYNLDAIISVGYRVNSIRGTHFRIWATQRLREYIIKGFTLDDERLKGRDQLADYFDELLARIREIRASEKRVYQRIREIFALASDYREGEEETLAFFAVMQNKMHYAATGLTAAEIVRRRADSGKANMGLTSWSGRRVMKRDVATAKNYLIEIEIDTLNRIVVMFLDQAEFRARRRQDIRIKDWGVFLDKFLRDTELPVLMHAGSVSREDALAWADVQYDAFAGRRRLEAEQEAEARYLDDLRASAKVLESKIKKKTAISKKKRID